MTDQSRLIIDLPAPLHAKLKIVAAKRGTTMRDYTVQALEHRLAEEPAGYLTADSDPVLAELWDNDEDSVYDEL